MSVSSQNQHQRELTVNPIEANAKALLFALPALLLFGLPYGWIWFDHLTASSVAAVFDRPFLVFALLVGGIVLHELIHGITWAFFVEGGFRSIRFGIMWKALAPYCHSTRPMRTRPYIIGALMPAVLLGFVPSLLSLLTGSLGQLLFGWLFIVAAGGDFLMVWVMRELGPNLWIQDHPSEIGCIVYNNKPDNR